MSSLVESLAPARARLRTGSLLPIAAPLALLAVALVATARGLVVQDTWLTLVAGRDVVEHGLPHVNTLTAMASGHRWVDQQWLAQAVLYGLARAGGVGLAFAACFAAILSAFALLMGIAQRRGASPLAILLFAGLAVVAAPWGLQLRAQSLALPLFALLLWLLDRERTALVLPLLCLWANVHGSVVVGIAVAVAYAVVTREPLLLLAPLMLFASPYAPHLAGYYRTMLLDPPFGRYITEWHRTTPSPLTAAFFALAAIALVLVVRRRRRLTAFDLVALALCLALGLEAIRGTIWFALTAVALLPPLATRREPDSFSGTGAVVFASAACGVVVAALAFAVARPPQAYPAAVAAAARGHAVLANEATADWLLWQLPSLRGRVAYDVSFEVLRPAQIRRLLVWRQLRPGWQRVVSRYDVVVDDRAHVARLVASGRWRRVLVSPRVSVAKRVSP